ncbi:SNF2 family amino-terminal protein, partial [Rhizoctonia solani AG-3 Rhs1AP]
MSHGTGANIDLNPSENDSLLAGNSVENGLAEDTGPLASDLFFDIKDEELLEYERQKQRAVSVAPLFRPPSPEDAPRSDRHDSPNEDIDWVPTDEERDPTPRAPSTTNTKSAPSSVITISDSEDEVVAPPPKKQKPVPSGSTVPSRAGSTFASSLPSRAQSAKPLDCAALFIGDLTVEAWSTVKGKGHLRPGELLRLERDGLPGKTSNKSKSNNIASITSAAKKKLGEDAIVRVVNSHGSEVGRIVTASARWIAKLLDKDLVHLSGSPLDPPREFKHTGDNFKISLKAYLKASAFRPLPTGSKPVTNKTLEKHLNATKKTTLFFEGAETAEEQALRERKISLVTLFNEVGLRPKRSGFSDFAKGGGRKGQKKTTRTELGEEADSKSTKQGSGSRKTKATTTETIGEGEEAEEAELEGEELNRNQLGDIYEKAQRGDKQLAFMDPADSFTLTLRPYQQQALHWMYNLERGEVSARDSASLHPLWEEYIFPFEEDDGVIDLCADERSFYFNPYSGELSLNFVRTENHKKGGVLADVGMGKSIMMSSLIHTSRATAPTPTATPSTLPAHSIIAAFGKRKRRDVNQPVEPHATLLIAPISLLSQWQSELDRSILGPQATGERPVDVVITSYGTLSSEYANVEKGKASQIYDIQWMRVVLDEAHYCKSRHTKNAKACYKLNSVYRWALTGTPIVNRLEDLFSLLCFLKYDPWSSFAYFKSFVTTPFLNRDPRAIEIIQVILENVLLRREKSMRDVDGNKIVELPPKVMSIEELTFSPEERRTYEEIYIDAKNDFGVMDNGGTITKGFAHMFAQIMRLRQAVLHPDLIKVSKEDSDPPSADIQEPAVGEFSCVTPNDLVVKEESTETESSKRLAVDSQRGTASQVNQEEFKSSTKVDALLRNLNELREQDSSFRAIVFSQFTSFLDIIQKALVLHGFESMRLDGSMSQQQRSHVLSSFALPSATPKVFCISLRAGGVGLNLTQAQYVFMMDFWWNRAAENQAIDRIHRIGQTRTVYVKHFVIKNTIEKRVLQIQKRKTAIVKGAFGKAGDKGTKESVQNMKLMFGD